MLPLKFIIKNSTGMWKLPQYISWLNISNILLNSVYKNDQIYMVDKYLERKPKHYPVSLSNRATKIIVLFFVCTFLYFLVGAIFHIIRNKLLKQITDAKLLGYDIKLTKTVWKCDYDFASPFPEENDRSPESPIMPDRILPHTPKRCWPEGL